MATATNTSTFQVGETYSTRSACDYDCVFEFAVIGRTAKFIQVEDRHGKVSRCKVRVWDGEESAYPMGQYSMAPVIRAGRS
jgi:hypothetical protein